MPQEDAPHVVSEFFVGRTYSTGFRPTAVTTAVGSSRKSGALNYITLESNPASSRLSCFNMDAANSTKLKKILCFSSSSSYEKKGATRKKTEDETLV